MLDEAIIGYVFQKSHGRCGYCFKVICRENRCRSGRGGWEIDHRIPQALGGTDHLNNLIAACWGCNVRKSDYHARTHRRWIEPEVKRRHVRRRRRWAEQAVPLAAILAGITYKIIRDRQRETSYAAGPNDDYVRKAFWWSLGIAAVMVVGFVVIKEMSQRA